MALYRQLSRKDRYFRFQHANRPVFIPETVPSWSAQPMLLNSIDRRIRCPRQQIALRTADSMAFPFSAR